MTRTDSFGHIFAPYCVRRIDNDRIILLNRYYKPLGSISHHQVGYKNYAFSVKIHRTFAKNVSSDGLGFRAVDNEPGLSGSEQFWLYTDADDPFKTTEADADTLVAQRHALRRINMLLQRLGTFTLLLD